MYEMLAVGDTSHNIFLEMTDETAHLHQIRHESCQLCFNYADKIPVKKLSDTIGGNSANAAVSFARLGLSTAFYTHVGGDDQGERIIKELKRNGVATDYVVEDEKLGTNFSTVINLHAERTILVYHLHRHYQVPKLEPVTWIYLSSMGEGSEMIFPTIVEYAKSCNAKICYQPGTFQLMLGAEKSAGLLANCEAFYVNKEEAEMFLGKKPTDNFRDLLDGLMVLGPKIVVVTDGPKGAYASDGTSYLYLGIIEEAPRIEATGAGDAFTSTFTAALAQGESLAEALRWGQCQSSSVIQKVGPQAGLLKKEELQQLLVKYPQLQSSPLS